MEISPPIPEKMIFEGILPYMGMVAIIGHINDFYFHVHKSLHTKFGYKWPSGFREKHVLIFIHKWPWPKVKN